MIKQTQINVKFYLIKKQKQQDVQKQAMAANKQNQPASSNKQPKKTPTQPNRSAPKNPRLTINPNTSSIGVMRANQFSPTRPRSPARPHSPARPLSPARQLSPPPRQVSPARQEADSTDTDETTRTGAVEVFKNLLVRAKAQAPTTFADVFAGFATEIYHKFRHHAGCMLFWCSTSMRAHNIVAALHNDAELLLNPDLRPGDDELWPLMPPVMLGRARVKEFITQVVSNGRTLTAPDWGIGLWKQCDSAVPPW
jgi:hypothetical protein